MLTFTDQFNKLLANAMKQHTASGNYDGPLSGCYVGLFTNNATLNQDTVLADLTEPTYTSYARQACTPWSAEFLDGDGNHVIQGPILEFQMGDNATPTTVYGYFLASAATVGNVLAAEKFSVPALLTTTENAVLISPQALAGNGNVGGVAAVIQ